MGENYHESDYDFDEYVKSELQRMSDFIDPPSLRKIINKMTDYGEVLTEGKLSGIVNFQYKLNSMQTNSIIDFLLHCQAVSRVHNVSLKGSRDLVDEYVSNIFSEVDSPEGISSFLSIRNIIENRLTHQTQQYNMNMGKTNTSMAMPISELRGHVRIYRDLMENKLSISTKAQHGIIAASLHDAYIKLLQRDDWYNDRTYMKFFYNEDSPEKREKLLLTGEKRLTLKQINDKVNTAVQNFFDMRAEKLALAEASIPDKPESRNHGAVDKKTRNFSDKMLLTPFGRQYGSTIDRILDLIFFSDEKIEEERVNEIVKFVFGAYLKFPDSISNDIYREDIRLLSFFLINSSLNLSSFIEKYLYPFRRDFSGKFTAVKFREETEKFIHECFKIYYDIMFEPVFRIIRSMDLKKYASAFIIKRIYLVCGEELKTFGYFFINTIAKTGNIKN